MKMTIEPTPEMWDAPVNGQQVPVRVWKGRTEGGVEIEAYVLSIVPNNDADVERMRSELPDFMVPSRQEYDIDTRSPEVVRAENLHKYGWPGNDG